MSKYLEKEIKVLDINVEQVKKSLENLGAKRVFEGKRIRTSYDSTEKSLISNGLELRITKEGETKFSLDQSTTTGQK